MIKLTDYIVKRLEAEGVKHLFMISGGGAMHLVDSVGRSKKIKYICPHHEQAAAIAAEGYARTSGKMGVVVVTSGPGGTNTLTGVIGQWLDSVPCLYLSGQVKFETTIASVPKLKLRQLGDQEINIVDIVKPVTKYAVMVRDPMTIRYHLERAIYLATHGRPGPVWLDIPLNVQSAMIDEKKLKAYDPRQDKIKLGPSKVGEVIKLLKKSKRPVLLIGQGVRLAGAEKELRRLVSYLNIPVLTAICAHDLIESDHPLFFGRPGICGDRTGNFVLQNCDLLIAIGARLGIRQIGYGYDQLAREARRIMVDIDRSELEKPTLKFDLRVQADAKMFIVEMLERARQEVGGDRSAWLAWCRKAARSLPTLFDDNPDNPRYVNSYRFADQLFRQLKNGDQVVTGNGTAYTSTFQAMRIKKGVRVIANQGCASMGYDLPAAIGSCLARKKRPVVLITGDGSLQMNLQELQTAVANQLPLKIFVLNNNGYLAIRMTQDAYFNGRHYAAGPEGGVTLPAISRIACAYGIKAVRISNHKELRTKIARVLSAKGPVLCEIMMDPKQTLFPKVSSAVDKTGKLISKPLEDMYPFVERKLFNDLMIVRPVS